MARFLDSSVFLHAYLRPKRELTLGEREVKRAASAIVDRVEKGERVITSVVHLSEILNVVEAKLGLERALQLLENFLTMGNIEVLGVAREGYEEALLLASRYAISPNDGLAISLSRGKATKEIYSFDRHFDKAQDVVRIAR